MVFADLFFLYVFLPLNLLIYYLVKNPAARNGVLLVFSFFFYAFGEPMYVFLLIVAAFVNWIGAVAFSSREGGSRKALFVLCILFNIGLLAVFKYSGFLVENLNTLAGLSLAVPKMHLPIGISFYVFECISYLTDVYRGETKAQRSFAKFLLYLSLYPQLVAGPIVRYNDVSCVLENRPFSLPVFSDGITRFLTGLGKKIIFANTFGQLASATLDGNLAGISVASAWFGIGMYTLQIYFDFSGYSDMAIGLGKMFGFHFPENFDYPYIARSAGEFWRRWHMTLGGFFRDYVYIPLGGNRKRVYLNLMIVWMLTGLWHGASWNFVLWGLYFGILISVERLFLRSLLERIPRFFSHLYLLFAVVVGWGMFYFTDASRMLVFLQSLFGLAGNPLGDAATGMTLLNNILLILLGILFCTPIAKKLQIWHVRHMRRGGRSALLYTGKLIGSAALLLLCSLLLVGQTYNPFLYYQF